MFNEVYDQLYKKNPDNLARKVNVAVPDPLHNKVIITENGEQDVVNYAVAKIDVEGGGGGSLDLHPKITMNVTVQGNSTSMINNAITGSDDTWVVIQGNNVLIEIESLGADNIVNFNDRETKEVTCFVPFDTSSLAVFSIIPERGNLQNITFANCVNCTGAQGILEITDHTQDASADVTLTFTGGE